MKRNVPLSTIYLHSGTVLEKAKISAQFYPVSTFKILQLLSMMTNYF